jgi:UPF0755 protein
MRRLFFNIFLTLSLLGTLLLGMGYFYIQEKIDQPLTVPEHLQSRAGQLLWTLEKGSNLSRVTSELHKLNIIDHPDLVNAYAKLSNSTSIKAGDYWISNTDTARTLLDKFNQGLVATFKITFPEGWTFDQWIDHLDQVPQFAGIALTPTMQLLDDIGTEINHPEGWFFPDTYNYSASDTAVDILSLAHQRMRDELDSAWQSRAADLPYKTAYEALIMASIIERETGVPDERREIAGVFVRRLQRGMRLQTDPTVIYGMGARYNGNIRRSDLREKTPYNTYRIDGLPPTPIAMPGAASLVAAVNPLSGSSLYFVARGDGSHQFSDTIEEHRRAVKHYQIQQRAKIYQSLPPQK